MPRLLRFHEQGTPLRDWQLGTFDTSAARQDLSVWSVKTRRRKYIDFPPLAMDDDIVSVDIYLGEDSNATRLAIFGPESCGLLPSYNPNTMLELEH